MGCRRTLVLIAIVAAVAACGDDDGQPEDVGACDGPPTVAAAVDLADGIPEVFVVRPGADPVSLTPDLVATDPAPAPDGTRVVVTLADGDYESAGPEGESLMVVDVDGSDRRDVTPPTQGVADHTPAWSPDGTQIAFVRQSYDGSTSSAGIWTVPADGGEPTEVAVDDDRFVQVEGTSWSPDGTQIAYVRTEYAEDDSSSATAVWIVGADGSSPRQVAPIADLAGLDWSADGARILAGGYDATSVVDVSTGSVTTVDGVLRDAHWSTRDGRVVGVTEDGEVVEQPIDGDRLGDAEVLLARDDVPESEFEGDRSPGEVEAVAPLPCRP